MKQKLTITDWFNDALTNYEDKISSISMEVDIEKDCECIGNWECALCKLVAQGELTDINSPNKKPDLGVG